ncbi:MAG TPA: ATP phosphoribosyltransferase [Thermoanaerobaculia bacterium]|nr:ATP phosphoribosyltransferase [Thermoanaerobaculia bacterium]
MIRLALPKGRNLGPTLTALAAGGLEIDVLDGDDRRLWWAQPQSELEVLLLKDRDLPLYVEYGVADLGVVGSDVLGEVGGDLLTPLTLCDGASRLSLIGRPGGLPAPGAQVRLATKYPRTARRLVATRTWGAEIVELSGSIELAPLLDLAELALDIVQSGRTLADNGLVELEVVAAVAPTLIVNRASFQGNRQRINGLLARLERAGVAR